MDKIYSLENIIDLTGGDGTFISEMIHMFISQAGSFKHDASTALADNDIVLLKHKAHKFKTSAQLFQVMQLHALLVKLEACNDLSMKEEIAEILKEIGKLSDASVKQLKEELKNY
jgi:HPt (histidine-containing phosphotransfer) domain-containing protein